MGANRRTRDSLDRLVHGCNIPNDSNVAAGGHRLIGPVDFQLKRLVKGKNHQVKWLQWAAVRRVVLLFSETTYSRTVVCSPAIDEQQYFRGKGRKTRGKRAVRAHADLCAYAEDTRLRVSQSSTHLSQMLRCLLLLLSNLMDLGSAPALCSQHLPVMCMTAFTKSHFQKRGVRTGTEKELRFAPLLDGSFEHVGLGKPRCFVSDVGTKSFLLECCAGLTLCLETATNLIRSL